MEMWKRDLADDMPMDKASDLDVMEAIINGFSPEILTSDEGVEVGVLNITDWECWEASNGETPDPA